MSRNLALGLFLTSCLILAVLLLADLITPIIGGSVFAIALALFGGFSRGFRGGT
jgi:uncharacterized membrane protein